MAYPVSPHSKPVVNRARQRMYISHLIQRVCLIQCPAVGTLRGGRLGTWSYHFGEKVTFGRERNVGDEERSADGDYSTALVVLIGMS